MTVETALQQLRDFLLDHPDLTGVTVFSIAFLESLAVIGLILPGVVLMFATGALVGMGLLPFWETTFWAVLGAFSGDLVSFWIGRRLETQIFHFRAFQRHRDLVEKGIYFFRRYGWLSILLGRFVGPLRPFVPLIAGIFEMPWPVFLTIAALAAFLWAPAYLLPGVLIGTSLGAAFETTGYVLLIMAALLVAVVFLLWLFWKLIRALHAYKRRWAWPAALALTALSLLGWSAWRQTPEPTPFYWQASREEIHRQLLVLGFHPWIPPDLRHTWFDGAVGHPLFDLYLHAKQQEILWLRPRGSSWEVRIRPLRLEENAQKEVEGIFLTALQRAGWCLQGQEIKLCR